MGEKGLLSVFHDRHKQKKKTCPSLIWKKSSKREKSLVRNWRSPSESLCGMFCMQSFSRDFCVMDPHKTSSEFQYHIGRLLIWEKKRTNLHFASEMLRLAPADPDIDTQKRSTGQDRAMFGCIERTNGFWKRERERVVFCVTIRDSFCWGWWNITPPGRCWIREGVEAQTKGMNLCAVSYCTRWFGRIVQHWIFLQACFGTMKLAFPAGKCLFL